MLLSLAVVVLGIYTAYVAYLRRPELPARVAARVPWAYEASFHKFYMDEFYDAAVIRPVMGFALWLWMFFDVKVIDGAVNGLAWAWDAFGRALRPLQTGRAQSYAFGVFAGMFVLIILIRYFWGA
jgi:NADH-quinone oxidoreductase subunit L